MEAQKSLKILIAVDGSEHAMAGIATVRDLKLPNTSQVTVMSVFIPRNASYYAEFERYVTMAQNELLDRPWQVKTEVIAGNPAEEISKYAEGEQSDLIVIGARGNRSALGVLLGGVAQQVVEYANRPVCIVRAPYTRLQRIVLALDGSPCSEMALRYLAHLPLPTSVKAVDILHVLPPPPLPQTLAMAHTFPLGIESAIYEPQEKSEIAKIMNEEEAEGQHLVEQAVKRYKSLSAEQECQPILSGVVLRGDAFEEINRYLEDHPAELIVVGSRGLSGVRGWLLGSLSRKLVHAAPCSVLVVRGVQEC